MKVSIDLKKLPFLLVGDSQFTEAYIEPSHVKGLYTLRAGTFKQTIKQSEYDQIVGSGKKLSEEKPAAEEKKGGSGDEDARKDELMSLTKAVLLEMAEEVSEEANNKMNKDALVAIILEAENDDEDEE